MKFSGLMFPVLFLSLANVTFAQSDAQKSASHGDTQKSAPTAAEQSFATMKSLAGDWEGAVSLEPPQPQMTPDKPIHVSMRVTSRGNALVHEMQSAGTPLDPTQYDHPVTMLYVD
ncbi:MAG: hypothetical protein WBU20_12505, partial [Candidatus Acidiferrum sp.]